MLPLGRGSVCRLIPSIIYRFAYLSLSLHLKQWSLSNRNITHHAFKFFSGNAPVSATPEHFVHVLGFMCLSGKAGGVALSLAIWLKMRIQGEEALQLSYKHQTIMNQYRPWIRRSTRTHDARPEVDARVPRVWCPARACCLSCCDCAVAADDSRSSCCCWRCSRSYTTRQNRARAFLGFVCENSRTNLKQQTVDIRYSNSMRKHSWFQTLAKRYLWIWAFE